MIFRELPTGKGFADIVLLPSRHADYPAIVLELKFNKSAHTAISQIRKQNYVASLQQYVGDILLVGINYDKKTKTHTCSIERITKSNTNNSESSVLNAQQRRVLVYCEKQPHTAMEIFNYLSISKQAKHYELYIHYLVENGFLVDVTPESKRNKKYKKV